MTTYVSIDVPSDGGAREYLLGLLEAARKQAWTAVGDATAGTDECDDREAVARALSTACTDLRREIERPY